MIPLQLDMPLADAQRWLRHLIDSLKDGGHWGVPRAATFYRIDKERKTFVRIEGPGDKSSEQVLATMGWLVETEEKK